VLTLLPLDLLKLKVWHDYTQFRGNHVLILSMPMVRIFPECNLVMLCLCASVYVWFIYPPEYGPFLGHLPSGYLDLNLKNLLQGVGRGMHCATLCKPWFIVLCRDQCGRSSRRNNSSLTGALQDPNSPLSAS